jgi:hypothetical protein
LTSRRRSMIPRRMGIVTRGIMGAISARDQVAGYNLAWPSVDAAGRSELAATDGEPRTNEGHGARRGGRVCLRSPGGRGQLGPPLQRGRKDGAISPITSELSPRRRLLPRASRFARPTRSGRPKRPSPRQIAHSQRRRSTLGSECAPGRSVVRGPSHLQVYAPLRGRTSRVALARARHGTGSPCERAGAQGHGLAAGATS